MAEELTLHGVEIKKRNPWGVWGLSIITLGIYSFVWWYKINREMRDLSPHLGTPLGNDPATSVWAIIFFPAVTVGTTTQRLRIMQYDLFKTFESRSNIGLAVLLSAVFFFHTVYLQYALNDLYDGAGQTVGQPGPQ